MMRVREAREAAYPPTETNRRPLGVSTRENTRGARGARVEGEGRGCEGEWRWRVGVAEGGTKSDGEPGSGGGCHVQHVVPEFVSAGYDLATFTCEPTVVVGLTRAELARF